MGKENIIPSDWNGIDYSLWMVCAPDSPQWDVVMRTAIYALTRGRNWDASTGNIIQTQQTAQEILETMNKCDDLITSLQDVSAAIREQSTSIALSVACCDATQSPVPVDPPAGGVPPAGTLTPPPNYGSTSEYDEELCRFANGIHYQVKIFIEFLTTLDAVAAVVTAIIALIAVLFPEPATTAIGTATLASIVAFLIFVEGGLFAVAAYATNVLPFWEAIQERVVCFVYHSVGASSQWKNHVVNNIEQELADMGVSMPNGLTFRRLFLWLEPYLDFAERDLYDFTQEVFGHDTPIDCAVCTNVLWFWDFNDLTLGGWVNNGMNLANQSGVLYLKPDSATGDKWISVTANAANSYFGLPIGDYSGSQVSFNLYINDVGGETSGLDLWCIHVEDDDTAELVWTGTVPGLLVNQWQTITFNIPTTTLRRASACLYLYGNRRGQSWANGSHLWVDDIKVDKA